jgi:hypothetical protein
VLQHELDAIAEDQGTVRQCRYCCSAAVWLLIVRTAAGTHQELACRRHVDVARIRCCARIGPPTIVEADRVPEGEPR